MSDEWAFEQAERRPGVKSGRTIVSVAFSRDDFARIARCAEQLGQKTSEFIRRAALEKAREHRQLGLLGSYSSSYGSALFVEQPTPTTRGHGVSFERERPTETAKA